MIPEIKSAGKDFKNLVVNSDLTEVKAEPLISGQWKS